MLALLSKRGGGTWMEGLQVNSATLSLNDINSENTEASVGLSNLLL